MIQCKNIMVVTFKLLSGPFQHFSPFENSIVLYESSNLSQRLFADNERKKMLSKQIKTKENMQLSRKRHVGKTGHLIR